MRETAWQFSEGGMVSLLYLIVFLLVPAAMLYLAHHSDWARKTGVVLLCYLAGLAVGNAGLVPAAAGEVQQFLSEASVALALPMLLFSLDIRRWSRQAGSAIVSMLLASTAVTAVATALFYLFREGGVQSASHMAAMSVGMYTGGTPNIAAIKTALDIPHSQYLVFHSLDTVAGGAYILLMLSVGVPLFRRLLDSPVARQAAPQALTTAFDEEDYRPLLRRENLPQLLAIVALSVLVLALSRGLSTVAMAYFSLSNGTALTIILLTTLGMALSFNQRVRRLVLSYRIGMYLIYVFCFAVATMASLADIGTAGLEAAVFVGGTVLGSLMLHAVLCKLAGIDSDTFMVTSVSAVCSPPFVPLMVKALGNPGLLLSGMTTGIIGYALGNYLGISLALFLQG